MLYFSPKQMEFCGGPPETVSLHTQHPSPALRFSCISNHRFIANQSERTFFCIKCPHSSQNLFSRSNVDLSQAHIEHSESVYPLIPEAFHSYPPFLHITDFWTVQTSCLIECSTVWIGLKVFCFGWFLYPCISCTLEVRSKGLFRVRLKIIGNEKETHRMGENVCKLYI